MNLPMFGGITNNTFIYSRYLNNYPLNINVLKTKEILIIFNIE